MPGANPGAPRVDFDDDLQDQHASTLRVQAANGDWRELEQWLAAVRSRDARCFYVDAISRCPGNPEWLGRWVKVAPEAALPYLVRGDHSIYYAWEARGSAWQPAEGSDSLFEARLRAAEGDLLRAAELDQTDPTPSCLLLRSGRGLGIELDEKWRRFHWLLEREPAHRRGHSEMLRALTAKWGGSHDAMFSFARDVADRSAGGSPLHTLIAEAHVERWLVADTEDGDATYWHRPEVIDDVHAAARRYFDAPEFQPTPFTVIDRSFFAFCFAQMADWTAARKQFEAMPIPYRWPWAMFGDPSHLLLEAKRQAMAAG